MNKFLKIRFKKRAADTMIEVIIAIVVMVLGSGAATSLIVSSMQANTFSKNSLVALNLAVEGMEAVRNIRDTNWIKFSYDKANCWNMQPGQLVGSDCTLANNKIGVDTYTIDLDPTNYTWDLTSVNAPLDLDGGTAITNENYRLYYLDVDLTINSDLKDNTNDDPDIYVSETAAGGLETGISRFYRMVDISYPNLDTMNVISRVQWTDGRAVHQVELSSSLTNFNRVKLN